MKKYAHFILASLGGLIVGTASPFTYAPALLTIIGVELIAILAFWYEWKQSVDPVERSKHSDFDKDSKQDVKQDLTGLFAGLFVGLAVGSILVNLI